MFKFHGFVKGGCGDLYSESRYVTKASMVYYKGMPLTLDASGLLIYAVSGQTVYAISNVSVASADVSATYKPQVFPVNSNQIWKAPLSTAITAAFVNGISGMVGSTLALCTSVRGDDAATGSCLKVWNLVTASDPTTSAVYVIFPDPVNRAV